MKLLITTGNTQTPLDSVRCITNIFSGRTGGRIAIEAHRRGHAVTCLTSHPEVLPELGLRSILPSDQFDLQTYRTFDDLLAWLQAHIPGNHYDAIIHSAAISDYALKGVYTPTAGTLFDADNAVWNGSTMTDIQAGKVKSYYPEVWYRLVPTPKLVDRFREPWGFRGILVKFKLEVDVSEKELLVTAEKSRLQSKADWLVANTLETMTEWAWMGAEQYERIPRGELAVRLLETVEKLAAPPRSEARS